jgi:hypothetical protein
VTSNLWFEKKLNCVTKAHIKLHAFVFAHSVYTSIVALAFLVTTFFFIIYERLVTRREKTKNAALRVLSTMFPSNVQEKVLKGADGRGNGLGSQQNMIASFYPATTVLFGMHTQLMKYELRNLY